LKNDTEAGWLPELATSQVPQIGRFSPGQPRGVRRRCAGGRTNQFGFNVTGTANITIVLEACTNLASPVWVPLLNGMLTNGSFYFSDPDWANYSGRFYRFRSP